jgi:hypothetical protein
MRMLVVGYPLPHARIDNYNVLTAPSYFDYDAVLVDPAGITRVVRDLVEEGHEFEASDGRAVVNGPTSSVAVSAAEQVRRRFDETQRFLENGGLVIVLARPNAIINGLFGFEGCDRYSWLPAPAGVAWAPPFLRPADGKTIRILLDDHPLAPVLRDFRSEFSYRATIDDRQAAVRQAGRVIANGGAGTPIAVEFQVLNGRVIFIPVPTEQTGSVRTDIAEALVRAADRLLSDPVTVEPPHWTRGLPLPGLEQVEAELEEAEAELKEVEERVESVRERHDALAAHRRVLWADGPLFSTAVAGALQVLGFTVASQPGEPLVVETEGMRAFVECESSHQQVVEWPYIRLQRRLEERLLKEGQQMKGIVVANGKREWAPEQREDPLSEPLRIACENYRYCLLTGETLFALIQRALGGADDAALTGIRRRVMGAAGLLATDAALGEVEEGRESGPIF